MLSVENRKEGLEWLSIMAGTRIVSLSLFCDPHTRCV